MYCEFHDKYGYAYVSRLANVEINVNDLYTTTGQAKIRIQKHTFVQSETIVKNLSRYRFLYTLSFQYNKSVNYTQPQNYAKLGPYLYLGFLPAYAANHVQPQGYQANGIDYLYGNCDGNPNSYIAFYFNPKFNKEVGYSMLNYDWPLMHGWVDQARDLPRVYHMPSDFFFLYEMHMGGCGGYAIAHHYDNILGAALGFPFGKTRNQ